MGAHGSTAGTSKAVTLALSTGAVNSGGATGIRGGGWVDGGSGNDGERGEGDGVGAAAAALITPLIMRSAALFIRAEPDLSFIVAPLFHPSHGGTSWNWISCEMAQDAALLAGESAFS